MDLEFHFGTLTNVPRPPLGARVNVVDGVLVKCCWVSAVKNVSQPRRLCQAEDAIARAKHQYGSNWVYSGGKHHLLWIVSWRADDSYALLHCGLVACVRMHVSAAHETRLRRMRVYPPYDYDVGLGNEIQYQFLIRRLAGIRSTPLLGDEECVDEQSIVDDGTAQQTTHLDTLFRLRGGNLDKHMAESGR